MLGLACVVTLKVPFGNALPSVAIIPVAMALMDRDRLRVPADLIKPRVAVADAGTKPGAFLPAILTRRARRAAGQPRR